MMVRLLPLLVVALLGGCLDSRVQLVDPDQPMRLDASSMDAGTEEDAEPADAGPQLEPCGDNLCRMDEEFCCNESCGICAALGGTCTEMACGEEHLFCGGEQCPEESTACCPGCEAGESSCSGEGGACPAISCLPPCGDDHCSSNEVCCPGCGPDEKSCEPADSGCPDVSCPEPVECGAVTCELGEVCCPDCTADGGYCSPGSEPCVTPDCPAPVFCGMEQCDADQSCCADCSGNESCFNGLCPLLDCPGPCEVFEARPTGGCDAELGYAFNGSRCISLSGCDCDGADCDRLYETLEQCEDATLSCRGCTIDLNCNTNEYCDRCAHASCSECEDCVADCVPHQCPTAVVPECLALRPECGTDGVAVVRDGCWECVTINGCTTIVSGGDCRMGTCPRGYTCSACRVDEWLCLAPGEACLN